MNKLVLIIVCLITAQASALNVQKFKPISGQEYEGIGIYSSYGIARGHIEASYYMSFLQNALEFGSVGSNTSLDTIAEYFLTSHFQFAMGLSDQVTFRASLPINLYSKVEPIGTYVTTEDVSMGDLSLNATFTLLDRGVNQLDKWGIGVTPFLTIPFQNEDDFFGDTSFTGGAIVSLDQHLHRRHYVAMNIGTKFRKKETLVNLTVGPEFLYGFSYVYRLSCEKKWDLVVELLGSTTYAKFFSEEVSSPYEGFLSVRKRSQNDLWEWLVGIGQGGNNGYGAPDYHLYSGFSYRFVSDKTTPIKHCCEILDIPPAMGTFVFRIENPNGMQITLPITIRAENKDEILYQAADHQLSQELPAGHYQVTVQEGEINHVIDFDIEPAMQTEKSLF
ncbi:MAG: hypothetical protein R3A45_02935 [Bdellovibrionota bacterium]